MNAVAQIVRATVSGVIRDLGTLWVRSLVTRAILVGTALLALGAAAAFLIVSAHSALSIALGPLYANLVVAAILVVIAAALYGASRIERKRAEARRQRALDTVSVTLELIRTAASAAASRNALAVVAAALAAGFLFGNASGDGGDEDE